MRGDGQNAGNGFLAWRMEDRIEWEIPVNMVHEGFEPFQTFSPVLINF